MNKLKTKDVFILRDKPKDMPDAIATKATSIFQKQSLYCFTKEELEALLKETFVTGRRAFFYEDIEPNFNAFIGNLLNENKESSLERESRGCFNEGDQG